MKKPIPPAAPPTMDATLGVEKVKHEKNRVNDFPRWRAAIEQAAGNISHAGRAEFPNMPASKARLAAQRQVKRLGLVEFARELRVQHGGKAGAGRPPGSK